MVESETIFDFYSSDKFEPILPEGTNFRHFRIKAEKGWKRIPRKIHSVEDLRKWVLLKKGTDLYYSTSQWLNPKIISAKERSGTYKVADNLLLRNDLVFDIDAEEENDVITLEGLDLARKSANNIYEGMKDFKEQFRFEYFAFTGNKGWRLVYKDLEPLPTNPLKRIKVIEKKRKVFISILLENIRKKGSHKHIYDIETFFDQKITTNSMCVIRLLGSCHSKTGFISTKLPVTWLRKSMEEIINHIPFLGAKRPVIPTREMIGIGDKSKSPCPRLLANQIEDVPGLASSIFQLIGEKYFLSNRIGGTRNNFIPVFKYQQLQTGYKKEIKKLQKKYKLGTMYIFKDGNNKVVISLKAMQRRQLQKVLNQSKSVTKHTFKKNFQILIPLITEFDEKIEGKLTGEMSKSHYPYAEKKVAEGNGFCGSRRIKLIKGIAEEI